MRISSISGLLPKILFAMYAILFLFRESDFYFSNFTTFATIDTILLVLSTIAAIFHLRKWELNSLLAFKSVILANVLTEIALRKHVDLYEEIYVTVLALFVAESIIFSLKK